MCSPPWALLGKISLQLRWGGNGDANEQPHGGCKQRQLQVLSLSPSAHLRQGTAPSCPRGHRAPLAETSRPTRPAIRRGHSPDWHPKNKNPHKGGREKLCPAPSARQLSCPPRGGFVLEICCWQIPLGTGISHQQLHGGDVCVCVCKAGLKSSDIISLSLSPRDGLESRAACRLQSYFQPPKTGGDNLAPVFHPSPRSHRSSLQGRSPPGRRRTSSCHAPHARLGQGGSRQGGRGDENRNEDVS